jgi:hypothetical protein
MTGGSSGGCDCPSCNDGRSTSDQGIIFRPDTGFARNPVTRYLAVELEVATTAADASAIDTVVSHNKMTAKYDGSVGDGCEITTQPAKGDDFIDTIKALTDAFTVAHATVDQRCGFHVHVDARDVDAQKLRRLLLVWAHVEATIYQCLPTSRRTNQYCKPMQPQIERAGIAGPSNPLLNAQLVNAISDRTWGNNNIRIEAFNRNISGDRYRSLNATSLAAHGTIEFRCAAGTVNYRKVTAWAMLVGSIVDWSFDMTEDDLQALLARDPWDVLLTFLCPTEDTAEWLVERRQKFDETTDPATLVRFPTFTPSVGGHLPSTATV